MEPGAVAAVAVIVLSVAVMAVIGGRAAYYEQFNFGAVSSREKTLDIVAGASKRGRQVKFWRNLSWACAALFGAMFVFSIDEIQYQESLDYWDVNLTLVQLCFAGTFVGVIGFVVCIFNSIRYQYKMLVRGRM